MAPVITLTTDFGTRDPYVAAMKGVLLARCSEASIVDLSHEIAPYDVLEAALFVAAVVPYFPPGTVHIVVVDPGVGTARRPLAARVAGQTAVCPDNGLLGLLWRAHPPEAVHEITELAPPGELSATFHGRDVFAPAAAAIAGGVALDALGPAVAAPEWLALPEPRIEAERALGTVIHVDRFGNAVTNLHRRHLGDGRALEVYAAGRALPLRRTYADVPSGAALALIGSAGYLEVAVNQGDAAGTLGLRRGDAIEVRSTWRPSP